ncbi:MAG: tol-pal system protein YbgF [Pseudomonadota bacterium]
MTNVCRRRAAAALLTVVTAVSSPLLLADSATRARLDSIERKLDSRGLMEMSNRIEQMHRDIQQMRGDLEVQAHTLKEMQQRSREQYLDIDRRLQQLETGQIGAPAVLSTTDTPADLPVPITGQIPPSIPTPTPAPAPAPAPAGAGERADYDTALAILREGRYEEATQAFNAFLTNYPSSEYADNANYWLGETYYVNRDFKGALAAFKGLVDSHPNSSKASDSLLKMGYIYYEQKDWAEARQALETVVSDYPGTTATRLAHDRLLRMTKEGH